jgi:hypothetical protein
MSMPVVASFLAGSIISLLMPVGLLIFLWVWYWFAAKRFGPSRLHHQRQETGHAEPPVAPQSEGTPAPRAP